MSVAISYLSNNGTVEAFVIGSPQWRASGKSKTEAENRLRNQLQERMRSGELKFMEFNEPNHVAESARDSAEEDLQAWREIAAEAYRERDAEKAAEFPE